MIRKALGSVVTFAGIVLAQAQDHLHDNHSREPSSSDTAPIKIVINPETRVSVYRSGDMPRAAVCGHAMELRVKIVNQGFMTARLQASLVDSVPEGVRLDFPAEPLKGIREEQRVLRITLTQVEPVDVTIVFRANNDIPDLGGRDRIHLLLRCT